MTAAQKEIDSLKEELNSRDIKIKWMQNKLRTETDARKVNIISFCYLLMIMFFWAVFLVYFVAQNLHGKVLMKAGTV